MRMKIYLVTITLMLLGCFSATKPKESVVDEKSSAPQVDDSISVQDTTEQFDSEHSDSEEEDCGC